MKQDLTWISLLALNLQRISLSLQVLGRIKVCINAPPQPQTFLKNFFLIYCFADFKTHSLPPLSSSQTLSTSSLLYSALT